MGRKKRLPVEPVEITIESLSHDGRGAGRLDGKAVFVEGALPGERVRFIYTGRRRHYDEGKVEAVIEASPNRVIPRCAHFERCGGCSLQHLEAGAQIQAKQSVLLDNLQRIGKVNPQHLLDPLQADIWQYRQKARLGVRFVPKKAKVLIGFREKRSSFITETQRCEILCESVGENIEALSDLIDSLSIKASIPQIEVAAGEMQTCLIFRVLEPVSQDDLSKFKIFGEQHGFMVMLQPGGPDTVYPVVNDSSNLYYDLPEQDLRLSFKPQDFTQVNSSINRRMISQALDLLDLQSDDRVLDLFCGLGNFTLPIARQVEAVVGVEGDAEMVRRAAGNADANGVTNVRFYQADLFEEPQKEPWRMESYHKVLLDPPRSGAEAVVSWLAGTQNLQTILYVSCNPATLARDAGILVEQGGYTLCHAGVMDMFPHTAHVEAMAVFRK